MKKISLSILTVFMLALTACGSASSGVQANSTQLSTDLPAATQLIVGTLNLEGTEQAVTSEQAKELLVMWQVYQGLTSSSSAAQAEIDGLVEQIQETMTVEQMETIATMNLTQQDIFAVVQEHGTSLGQTRQGNSDSNSTDSSGGFIPPDGGMPGGAPPDGGAGGVPMDGGMADIGGAGSGASTDQSQDRTASQSVAGDTDAPPALIEALIQVLQQKVSS